MTENNKTMFRIIFIAYGFQLLQTSSCHVIAIHHALPISNTNHHEYISLLVDE